MKLLILALGILSATSSFAQGHGMGQTVAPLLSLEHPITGLAPTFGSTSVTIYMNGRVVKATTTRSNRPHAEPETSYTQLASLTSRKMASISRCMTKVDEDTLTESRPRCFDTSDTVYKGIYGNKQFAGRYCAQLITVAEPCAKKMVELLDQIENAAQ